MNKIKVYVVLCPCCDKDLLTQNHTNLLSVLRTKEQAQSFAKEFKSQTGNKAPQIVEAELNINSQSQNYA